MTILLIILLYLMSIIVFYTNKEKLYFIAEKNSIE